MPFHQGHELWIQLLADRGLSRSTIDHFHIAPRGQGWVYPIHPLLDEKRWKAFNSQATPKYLWLPRKSDRVRFYDVDRKLRRRISKGDGVLWLACGEADVWALWEGGMRNATCLFDGEARHIPEWFVPELEQLGVKAVHLAPDRDEAGTRFALHIGAALQATSICVHVHRLPFRMGSGGDIGRLLVRRGRSVLKSMLEHLPEVPIEVPPTSKETATEVYWQLPLPKVLPDYRALYDHWCIDIVETTAQRVWNFSPPNRKGFSKGFRCPFHDDHHPSASWNYHTHGVHCFACGHHGTREVADLLSVLSWQDFKAENLLLV
jgi:hypothetical protein